MSKAQVKKALNELTKTQLVEMILDLYDARAGAKEYLEFFVNPNSAALYEKASERIKKNFFKNDGNPLRNAKITPAKTVVKEFVKSGALPEYVLNLLIDYCINLTNYYVSRNSSESFGNATMRAFEDAARYAEQAGLFKGKARKNLIGIANFWTKWYTHFSNEPRRLLTEIFPEENLFEEK